MIIKYCVLFFTLFALVICNDDEDICDRGPPKSATRYPKSPGDNGFKIILSGNPERYVPETLYTVTLVGSRTHNRLQQFTRFSLGAELRDPSVESDKLRTGYFTLFADTISTFNEDCSNTIIEANDLPKTEVQVMWRAPKTGSGCVVLKAMVYENPRRWFMDDGQLSFHICEETSNLPNEDACCACDEAKYEMIFEGIWSKETHPKDFPIGVTLTHFSDVIGASHVKNFTFWGEGQIASDGFRSLAEWGSVRLMEQELRLKSKYLKTIIKAAGLWYPRVNSNTSSTFKVDNKKHLVSLASMLGPTPDWVVGINGYDLCQKDCTWKENIVIDLYPYDAGTDSGITYMSPNEETKPREKMFRITTKYPEDPRAPFYNMESDEMNPLARLFLKRTAVIPKPCNEKVLEELAVEVSDNTEDAARVECTVGEYSSWTPCSVTCGKGLRTRTREYLMPMEKIKMFGCNRQLVSKEMCVADIPECDHNSSEEVEGNEDFQEENESICLTGEWGPWSECSATCGVGFNMRTRRFLNRMGLKKCPHISLVEKEKCMAPACSDSEIDIEDPECPVTPWSDWSTCSSTCGRGIRVRMRLLLAPDTKEFCSDKVELTEHAPCTEREDCTLDMATAKQVCMEETDPGLCRGSYLRWSFNTQKAMCVPFSYNGCKGNKNNFLTQEDCMNTCGVVRDALLGSTSLPRSRTVPSHEAYDLQPVDCMVTDWSDWSPCSVSCGRGYSQRFRMIKLQASNGGVPCPRKLVRKKPCIQTNCYYN